MDTRISEVNIEIKLSERSTGRFMTIRLPFKDYFMEHPEELKRLIIEGLTNRKNREKLELDRVKEEYKLYKTINSVVNNISQSDDFKRVIKELPPKQKRMFRRRVKNAIEELTGVSEDYLLLIIEASSKQYRYYQAMIDIFKKMDADKLLDLLQKDKGKNYSTDGEYDD